MWEGFGDNMSKNHHFYGDIAAFFQEYIAGLYYVFDRVRISPCFVKELDFAQASCRDISVRWERQGENKIILTVNGPEYVNGDIVLREGSFEDGFIEKPLEPGTYNVILE